MSFLNKIQKRFTLLLVLGVLFPALCGAGPVASDRAKKIAENFLSMNGRPSAVVEERGVSTKASGREPYYIFNSVSDGFVIVSGDDAARPVLAYSLTGSFDLDDAADFITEWLDAISHDVMDAKPTDEATSQWRNLEKKVQTKVVNGTVVLKTAEWNQGAPFNDKCPIVNGERALTGCVATAGAIIMRYHKWPERYDWKKMPEKVLPYGSYDEIAELMAEIGQLIDINYGADATYGSTEKLRGVLYLKMDYRLAEVTYLTRLNGVEMVAKCSHEINNECPVLISAQKGEDSGHAFVIDGYDGQGNLHINWGWGGRYNGFFTFPEFRDYNEKFWIYTGISKPDATNIELLYDSFAVDQPSSDTYKAKVTLSNSSSVKNYSGFVAIGKFNRFDELEEIVSDSEMLEIAPDGTVALEFACTLTSSPELGDYFMPVHKAAGKEEYVPAIYVGESSDSGMSPVLGVDALEAITDVTYDRLHNELIVNTRPDAMIYVQTMDGVKTASAGVIDLSQYQGKRLFILVRIGANILKMEVVL